MPWMFNWTSFTVPHYPHSIFQTVKWWWRLSLQDPCCWMRSCGQLEQSMNSCCCPNVLQRDAVGWFFFFSKFKATSHFIIFFTSLFLVISASVSAVDLMLCLLPQQEWLHGNDQFRSNLYCWLIHQCIDLVAISMEPLSKHQLSCINL